MKVVEDMVGRLILVEHRCSAGCGSNSGRGGYNWNEEKQDKKEEARPSRSSAKKKGQSEKTNPERRRSFFERIFGDSQNCEPVQEGEEDRCSSENDRRSDEPTTV